MSDQTGYSYVYRWLEEIDRKQAEMVSAQIALEKLRQRDRLLTTENEMLKVVNYLKYLCIFNMKIWNTGKTNFFLSFRRRMLTIRRR